MLALIFKRLRSCVSSFAVLLLLSISGHVSAEPSWYSYSAGIDEFPDKVRVNYSVAVADCSSQLPFYITVFRDGVSIAGFPGVSGSYDDTTATPGVIHTYRVEARVNTPGYCLMGYTINTPNFNGRRSAGAPTPVTMTGASDGAYTDRVRVSYTRPDISSVCTAANYVLVRDGVDLATIATGVTGVGSASYDDLTATPGVTYGYWIRTNCTSSGQSATSSTDSGYAQSPPPPAPTSIVCSDGTYTDRVRCTVTAPAAPGCTSRDVIVAIDGVDNHTISTIPVAGGSDWRETFGLSYGTHTFTARSVCIPSNTQSTGVSDTGFRQGIPVAPTSVSASDYLFADRVDIAATIPASPQCTFVAVVYSRDGTDIHTDTTVGASGGPSSFSDVGVSYGLHTYGVRTVCSPGGAASSAVTDSGARLGTPPAPTSISASDYTDPLTVSVSITAPAAAMCTTRDVILSRDGVDIATITTIPVGGGSTVYVDSSATMGVHTYAARSRCNPSGVESSAVTDTGARAYPTPTCSALSLPTGSIPFSTSTTIPVTVTGITNAVSARIRVHNSQNGTNDLFTYALSGAPTGTATIALSNHASGSPEYGMLNVSVVLTGSNPADSDVQCATGSVAIAPGAPTGFTASDGNVTDSVNFTWDPYPGVGSFTIYQCPFVVGSAQWANTDNTGAITITGMPCTAVVAGIPGSASSASFAVPGALHQQNTYVIHGVTADGLVNTPLSNADGGFPNRAPQSATAVGMLPYASTSPVNLTMAVVDANPADAWDYSATVTTTARGGTIEASGTQITYTPPAAPFIGSDTFSFVATDGGGATVVGTGTIDGGCPDPAITSLSAAPSKIFAGVPARVDATYGNAGCTLNHNATLTVLYSSTTVRTVTQTAIPSTASGPLSFDIGALGTAGNYVARLTITNTVTGRSVSRDHTFQVVTYQLPTATITPRALEKVQPLTLTVNASSDCQLTTDSAVAMADTNKCLVEVVGLPSGMVPDTAVTYPAWTGVPSTAGTYPVTVRVSRYDYLGSATQIGEIPVSTTVLPLTSLTFSAPTPLDAKQYLRPVQSSVKQDLGLPCALTEDVAEAQAAYGLRVLRCLVTVDAPPAGFTRIPYGLYGTPYTATVAPTNWRVSIFDSVGTEHTVASGAIAVNVSTADLRYEARFNPTTPVAAITPVTVPVVSIGSDTCPVTTSVDVAQDKTRTTCLFEWGAIPAGLSQLATSSDPMLRGNLSAVGTNTASYTVSVFDNAATKYTLFSGSATVDAAAPPSPTINLTNMREAGTGIYAVPLAGGFFGVLNNCTGCGAISFTQTITGDATSRNGSIFSPTGRSALMGTAAPLYTQRAATLRVALTAAPTIFAQQSFTLLTVPPEDVKLNISIPSAEVPDTLPLTVTANIGRFTRDGFQYVEGDLGQWRVRFGVMDGSGSFVPLTSFVTADATGTATGTISTAGYVFMRLAAQAESITPITGYSQTVKSTIRVASVVKGTPIDATVQVSATSGPAPLISQLKVVYATRADQIANQSISWEYSADGGTTWSDVPDVSAATYFVRAPAGVSTYRARFVNRNTGEPSYSPPVSVTAWDNPKVVITGPGYSFPGSTLNFTAAANDAAGSAVPGAVFEWSVAPRSSSTPPPSPIATGSGSSASFAPSVAGSYTLTYRARYPSSPDADPRSWTVATKQISVNASQKPSIRFTGPARAEVGKAYDYSVSLTAPFPIDNSPHTIAGEWTLPDGSTSPGTTLSWTPTPADIASSTTANLRYTAWIVGFESTTTVTLAFPVRLWEYVFPTWSVNSVRSSTYSPSNFSFTAVPSNATQAAALEGLTYSWIVPPGLSVVGTPTNKLNTTSTAAGDYTVTLTVSDSRGNTQSVDSTQTAVDPPPYAMTVAVSKVSRWSHSPLTVGITPKVTGGHPSDRIVTWNYFVDGVPQLGLPNRAGVQIVLPDARSYNVEAQAVSAMGATATQSSIVNVPANIPATCTLTATPSSTRRMVSLRATCTDPDGAITRLQWFVNGVERTSISVSSWTYYLADGESLPIDFSLTVTDDGGGTSTASATAN